jgi:hypothetical protein
MSTIACQVILFRHVILDLTIVTFIVSMGKSNWNKYAIVSNGITIMEMS